MGLVSVPEWAAAWGWGLECLESRMQMVTRLAKARLCTLDGWMVPCGGCTTLDRPYLLCD